MSLTQPFSVNWTGVPDFYTKFGLLGHNGIDCSAPTGTEVFSVMSGTAYCDATGYGNEIRVRSKILGLEVINAHLLEFKVKDGEDVMAGQLIGLTDNTGYSTGPHFHLGVRRIHYGINGDGPYYEDLNNGYNGWLDPATFFVEDIFDLPVDKRYGLTPRTPDVKSEIAFFSDRIYFYRTQKRLMNTREANALRFGFWPLRTVIDQAMFPIWSEMTQPEAKKRKLI